MQPKFFYILGLAIVLATIMNILSKRKKSAAWKGTVTEIAHQRKHVTRDEDRRDDDWVTIVYRNDAGASGRLKLRMRLFRQFYPGLKAGDRLVKPSGAYYPDVESEATESGPAAGE